MESPYLLAVAKTSKRIRHGCSVHDTATASSLSLGYSKDGNHRSDGRDVTCRRAATIGFAHSVIGTTGGE
jgi:hypothetical protein